MVEAREYDSDHTAQQRPPPGRLPGLHEDATQGVPSLSGLTAMNPLSHTKRHCLPILVRKQAPISNPIMTQRKPECVWQLLKPNS